MPSNVNKTRYAAENITAKIIPGKCRLILFYKEFKKHEQILILHFF